LLGTVEMARSCSSRCGRGPGWIGSAAGPVLIAGDFRPGPGAALDPDRYAAGGLTIWQLYAVGFITGSLTVLFDVADQS